MANFHERLVAALQEQLATRKPVAIPAGGFLLWKWFGELSMTRTVHAAGVNPISFGEIDAYFYLRNIPAEQRHIDSLMAMDRAYLEYVHTMSKPLPEGSKALPPISKKALSVNLFDAMMG